MCVYTVLEVILCNFLHTIINVVVTHKICSPINKMVVKAMMIQTFELLPSSSSSLAAGTLVEAGIIVLLAVT